MLLRIVYNIVINYSRQHLALLCLAEPVRKHYSRTCAIPADYLTNSIPGI